MALRNQYAQAAGTAAGPAADTLAVESPFAPRNLLKFLVIVVQVALLVRVMGGFRLESVAFLDVVNLALMGFIVHHFAPHRHRLWLFVLISLGGIWIVFGFGGAWLVGIGLGLIAVCHLPVPWWGRVSALFGLAALLVLFRGDWLSGPVPAAVWPILGSMFMFRLIVYMYDLRHDPAPVSPSRTLAYFFMLPNVCFPLFPVVDYKTFRRTYYDDDPFKIYQRGVDWMLRGVIHLLLYRLVYYHLTLAPSDVSSPADLGQWMVTGFLLYLRVSGQFHLIVGMLHLFGFHLPETHKAYFLASSFTDFWRRINIYWKDFMLKIFFFPIYFRLKRWGPTTALVLATLLVFAGTWFLHAYQWFWLRGTFLLSWPDLLFWTILGCIVVVNALYEDKFGRKRTLAGAGGGSLRIRGGRVLATIGTFTTICVLWSLWSSESLQEWAEVWALAFGDPGSIATVAGPALLLGAVAGLRPQGGPALPERGGSGLLQSRVLKTPMITAATILGLYVVGTPFVYSQFGATAAQIIESVRQRQLNQRDAALLHRGYYENLMSVDRFNSQLWEVYAKKPVDWVPFRDTEAVRQTDDFLLYELLPNISLMHRGAMLRTNRWGMRDGDYDETPSAGTRRLALLGSSHTMGVGVEDDEVFEHLVENRLNSEKPAAAIEKYELLNFAVAGHTPLQHLFLLERTVLRFKPDTVVFVAHSHDGRRTASHVADSLSRRVHIPYDFVVDLAREAGLSEGVATLLAQQRLQDHEDELLGRVYRRIADVCRQHGIVPVWVFVPMVGEETSTTEIDRVHELAAAAGFVVLSLRDVYGDVAPEEVRLAEWDEHPNPAGHRLVADRLYQVLAESDEQVLARPRDVPLR